MIPWPPEFGTKVRPPFGSPHGRIIVVFYPISSTPFFALLVPLDESFMSSLCKSHFPGSPFLTFISCRSAPPCFNLHQASQLLSRQTSLLGVRSMASYGLTSFDLYIHPMKEVFLYLDFTEAVPSFDCCPVRSNGGFFPPRSPLNLFLALEAHCLLFWLRTQLQRHSPRVRCLHFF